MSHEIENHDRIVSLEPCWHGLEQVVPAIQFDNSGLDWTVEQRPMTCPSAGNEMMIVPGYSAIVRQDIDLLLHATRSTYSIIQNSRIWELVENSLAGIPHKVAVTGSLQDCRKVFISVSLDEANEYKVGDDVFKAFLTFASSHNESIALEGFDSNVRVVCANTLRAARGSKGRLNLRVIHSGDVGAKIAGMEAKVQAVLEYRNDYYASLVRLMDKPVSMEDAERIVVGYISEESEHYSMRAQNQVEEIVRLFESGHGNHGKSRYDLLNGLTEFYTHHAASSPQRGILSNEFGSYADQKSDFYAALLSDKEVERLTVVGQKLLDEAATKE